MNKNENIIIFAKVPGIGIAKSRIAETEGRDVADCIYRELLKETAGQVDGFEYHVAYTGAADPGELKQYFSHAKGFFRQEGHNLGDRLKHAFRYIFDKGYKSVCAVGCDCPAMQREDLEEAFHFLNHDCDTVIGPALDGGYYLIGCNPHSSAALSAKQWSSANLLTETLGIIFANGFTIHLLPSHPDIDRINDYRKWKKQLLAA
ncbi:MAG: DUF2064 domain-containing protein [Chitinivibrionales bacterium]|nr:DUF2064 domain-containing protein [Chitinivibrionales bacterium]